MTNPTFEECVLHLAEHIRLNAKQDFLEKLVLLYQARMGYDPDLLLTEAAQAITTRFYQNVIN
jgi:hypothetical protein